MATQEEVKTFLSQFKTKSKLFNIVFRENRLKNMQTLALLEITAIQRKEEVLSLDVTNYHSGPHKDTLNKSDDMWVFGKIINRKEVYIKITLGGYNNSTICISFHIAEHKMSYPFISKE